MQESCEEHMEIAEAIAAADQERAGKVARAHIERTRMTYHRCVPQG
jgi:DNA-binding FadR family transcriptional regulator